MLTCALEKRGRTSHVRAVGSYVSPTFFKHLKGRKQHMKNEHLVDLKELNKKIVEHDEMIWHLHDRLSKLEAAIAKCKDNEQKESCSDKQPCHSMDEDLEEEEEDNEVVFVEKVDVSL